MHGLKRILLLVSRSINLLSLTLTKKASTEIYVLFNKILYTLFRPQQVL